jgi:hypothetical protein
MARRFFGFAKLVTVSTFSLGTQFAHRPKQFFARCQDNSIETLNSVNNETIVIHDEEVDDEEWLKEKEKCSFCTFFLGSPCRNQFIKWSKCVDLAKSKELDFIKSCSVYTKALMECTSEHDEYFAKAGDENTNEDEEESPDIDDVEPESSASPTEGESQFIE